MKKNNICTKTISGIVALTASLVLIFASCSNGMNLKDGLENSSDGKTYIKINAVSGMERTLSPKSDGLVEKLTSLELKGTPRIVIADDATVTEPEEKELAKADSFEELSKMAIPVDEGVWVFVLTADLEGVPYSGEASAQIEKGKVNPVTITMCPETTYGGMSITVEFTGEADKVVVSLKKPGLEELLAGDELTPVETSDGKKSVTFSRSAVKEDERLESGTYYLLFEFFGVADGLGCLNTLENIVRVTKGITTKANLKLDLNEVYTITYQTDGASPATADDILTNKYSRKSGTITLPRMKKAGYAFAGWFDNAGFEGNPITEISEGSTGNKTLYAGFTNSVTVAADGDGNLCNGMKDAFNSIETALMKINEWNDDSVDYTIYIDGTLTGSQVIKDTTDDETDVTTPIAAKSITLCGKNGSTDKLDGQFTGEEDNYGTTLTINTSKDVTVRNLTITGGYSNTDFGGGGIYIEGESKVILGDGALITGNHSAMAAAGILVYDKATLTMNEGAAIKENISDSANTEAGLNGAGVLVYGNGEESETLSAKFIMNGGSISQNTAIAYGGGVGIYRGSFEMTGGTIGGKSEDDGNEATIYNGSTFGGGVWVGSGSSFTMSGGLISNNKALGEGVVYGSNIQTVCGGGGVYVSTDSTFTMTGGEISNNNSASCGGGVFIGGDTSDDGGGTFTMEGGKITHNSATNNGDGVYLRSSTSKFILNGSSIDIADTDDIYLPSSAYITIASNDLMDGIKITLTPADYTGGNQVLLADNEADLSLAYDIFAVTPQVSADGSSETIKWCVTEEGKLARDGVQTYYVNASAGSDTGDGSAANPFATITNALAKIEANAKEDLAYTIVVSGLTSENVGIGATYNTSDSEWEKNDNLKAASITLQGSSESTGGNGIYVTEDITPMYIQTEIPITFSDFTIKVHADAYTCASTGAAIYLAENSNVTLSGRTLIDGSGINRNDRYGAIYVSNATLTLKDDASIANWKLGEGNGIYVTTVYSSDNPEAGSKVYMKGNSSITGCVGSNGGGIYVTGRNQEVYSEVYMEENSSITSCTGSSGGGIYVSEGKVYMSDTAVIGGNGKGCTASMWGGGVYVDTSGTFEMGEDATIQYCTISTGGNGGAGVFVKGTFNLENGKISNNQGSGVNIGGGGICIRDGGTVTMTGGEISSNSFSYGGGVYIDAEGSACQFDMQGGSISNNTLTDTDVNGKGVYVCNSYTNNIKNIFKMRGNAVVASNNDVYLKTYGTDPTNEYRAKITIAGALTGTTPVATITPDTYGADIQVLELVEDVNTTTLADEYSKFDVTPEAITGSTVSTYWMTTETGTIGTFTFGTKDSGETKELFDIVFVDGTATPYIADLELTDKQKAGAVAIIFYTESTSEGDLGVKTLGLGVNQTEEKIKWAPYGTSGYDATFTELGFSEEENAPATGTPYWSKNSKYYTGYVDGSDSWSKIQAADSDASEANYPVFAWANNYDATYSTGVVTNGWYIPTAAEFLAMEPNLTTINTILSMLGKPQLVTYKTASDSSDSYWTSNTSNSFTTVWQFEISNSFLTSQYRRSDYYAVAIREF